jgi:hypothetical protein
MSTRVPIVSDMSRRLPALLLAAALLTGCGAGAPDVLEDEAPAAATVERQRPAVPQTGPWRHSARADFRWRVLPVTAARLGSSHRAGCPVVSSDLRLLQLTHLDFAGRSRTGELVVHRDHARSMVEVFRRLYEASFPIARMVTVDAYGGDDDRSMAANNTSAYNCRAVAGGSAWSEHAYGAALDINPVQNPYVRGTTVEPEAGRAYLDRSRVRTGMIVDGDEVVRAFAAVGWGWGGDFRTFADYQHFSASGR